MEQTEHEEFQELKETQRGLRLGDMEESRTG